MSAEKRRSQTAATENVVTVFCNYEVDDGGELMVSYGSFTYSDPEVGALTTYLRDCARREQITHYDDACSVAQKFGSYHGPHDQRLWWLLGYISEEEIKAGRCALSAIVVIKSGEGANRPGHGFFELERRLGRYKSDDDSTWLAEIDGLFQYWRKH